MVDEILGVYVDAASVPLVRHERQSDVDAAVVLPLVDLSNTTPDGKDLVTRNVFESMSVITTVKMCLHVTILVHVRYYYR